MLDRRDFVSSLLLAAPAWGAPRGEGDWRHYANDAGASRFSSLDKIKRGNVAKLKPVWTHRSEDASQRPSTTIECTPLVIGGTMYITTARAQVRALNAATGEAQWNFDPLPKSMRG